MTTPHATARRRNSAKTTKERAAQSRARLATLANRPITEIAAAFGVDEYGDVSSIPDDLRLRAFRYLAGYASGGGHLAARTAAEVESWELQNCRRLSKTFARLQDDIRQGIENDRKMCIEDVMYQSAVGELRRDDGYYPPSERAAGILLPAIDSRYRPTAQVQPQAVQINISI